MDNSNLLERIEQLEAVEAIRQKLHLYCRGIDRRDTALLQTIFWEGSSVDFGVFKGDGMDFASNIAGMLDAGGIVRTHHLVGNITITVNGSTAHSESYLQAFHHLKKGDGKLFDWLVGGRYQDRFERRNGDWRIASRNLIYEWYRDWPDSCDWTKGVMGLTPDSAIIGKRAPDSWLEISTANA